MQSFRIGFIREILCCPILLSMNKNPINLTNNNVIHLQFIKYAHDKLFTDIKCFIAALYLTRIPHANVFEHVQQREALGEI